MFLAAYPNKETTDPAACLNIYEIADSQAFAEIVHPAIEDQNFNRIRDEILNLVSMTDDELRSKLKMFEHD